MYKRQPEQYVLIPVDNKFLPYCHEVAQQLSQHDIRGFVDERNEKIGKKIRDNEIKKIPLLLIVGEKEIESKSVAVRKQGEGDLGVQSISEFVEYFNKIVDE